MTRTSHRSWAFATLLLTGLFGCKAETFGENDNLGLATDPVTLHPSRQWSGGEITLVSAALAGLRDGSYAVKIDGREIPATRIAPDSVRVRLPADLRSGSHPVVLNADGDDWNVGAIEAVGWSAQTDLGTQLCSDPVPWPVGHPEGILVASCERYQPPMFIGTDGRIITYPELEGSGYSPSSSYRERAVNDHLGRVAHLDRFAPGWDSLAPGRTFSRHGYELGPGVWLTTSNHYGSLSNLTTGALTSIQLESEWLLVRSPAGRRATFVVSVADPGIPILDTDNGTILSRVEGLVHTDAAVFSLDGSVLFADAAPAWCCSSFLTKIATETGTVLQIDSSRAGGHALAVDAGTPGWLYEVANADSVYLLRVRNADDLSVVAEFSTPDPGASGGIYPGLIIDAARRHGYVFLSGYPNPHLLRFDLLIPGD